MVENIYRKYLKYSVRQTLLLQEIPIGTLCLVQAVRQQYSSIGAACSADMAPHKLRMTISRRVYFL